MNSCSLGEWAWSLVFGNKKLRRKVSMTRRLPLKSTVFPFGRFNIRGIDSAQSNKPKRALALVLPLLGIGCEVLGKGTS